MKNPKLKVRVTLQDQKKNSILETEHRELRPDTTCQPRPYKVVTFESPVLDIFTVPQATPSKLSPNSATLQLMTFFLVIMPDTKTCEWVPVHLCKVISEEIHPDGY